MTGEFGFVDVSTAELERQEAYLVPLADSVRRLLGAVIRTGPVPLRNHHHRRQRGRPRRARTGASEGRHPGREYSRAEILLLAW